MAIPASLFPLIWLASVTDFLLNLETFRGRKTSEADGHSFFKLVSDLFTDAKDFRSKLQE